MMSNRAKKASTIHAKKIDFRPNHPLSNGAKTIAIAKDTPMLAPIVAIALLRFCSVVSSASKASKTPAIAPEPCSALPTISIVALSAKYAISDPTRKRLTPKTSADFRPMRSDSRPNGIWNSAWVSP